MSKPSESTRLDDPQAVLNEINALLGVPDDIDEARAKKVRKAIENLRGASEVAVPGDDAPATEGELDAQIDAGLEQLRARVHKQVERRNHGYEKALELMDELEATLQENELQKAEHAHHCLMSIMGNITGLSEKRWKDIDSRLQRVRPRLHKLESWRHWGTTQARQELINEVTRLTGSDLPPEKLAKRIQKARDQWHAWDKSGDRAGKELWKTFDQACETAYKPCTAYFEKLKKERSENLRQRRAIIDKLTARYDATDWKHPDWRELDKFTSRMRREFYKIGNVDYKHRKPLSRALDEGLGKYEDHLSMERERSLRSRERLIADIEELAGVEDLREALERLEALKKQWTITVVGKRNQENRLWKRFQAACDATYRRRDAERKEQAAERNANLKQKQALINELLESAGAGDEELLAHTSTLARLQDQWEAIGWIPRKQEPGINRAWRDARKKHSQALKAARSRARSSELDHLARRAALCGQWEQAILAGDAPDADTASAEWSALPALSGTPAEAMEQRFGQALIRTDEETLAQNLAAKQAACLRLEVLLELESPAEHQAERMAYQIERLNASMKKGQAAQEAPGDLLLSLLTTGAVPAADVGAIEQRIHTCLARYKERS